MPRVPTWPLVVVNLALVGFYISAVLIPRLSWFASHGTA
jgi:hypothetical protein